MRVALCCRQKLRPPLLTENLQLLELCGRQNRFHLRVRSGVYRLKPLEFFNPGERLVVPDRLQLWLLCIQNRQQLLRLLAGKV